MTSLMVNYDKNLVKLSILSLILFILTSIFSVGFYHADEHYQILEFAYYKLGLTPLKDMAWEFTRQIRPALQPAIALLEIKALNFIGVYNSFVYAFILRLISGLLAWIVYYKLSSYLFKDFITEQGKRCFLFLCFFLWYIPYTSVRFSSENWSAITFFAALLIILKSNDKVYKNDFLALPVAGLLLGFSFFFRFQIAFAFIGLGLWLIIKSKISFYKILNMCFWGTVAIAICVLLDSWFYGHFVLTPYNYFYSNIVEHVAANFGTEPIYYYFTQYVVFAIPILSIALLYFFFIGIKKKSSDAITWSVITFILAHSFIAHKEMRFLFSMTFGFVYLASIGIDSFISNGKHKKIFKYVVIISLVINVFMLVIKTFLPAQETIPYYKFLYNYSYNEKYTLLSLKRDIYDISGPEHFYKTNNINVKIVENRKNIEQYLADNKPKVLLLAQDNLLANYEYPDYKSQTIYCPYPRWIVYFNVGNWVSRASIWKIERLTRINHI